MRSSRAVDTQVGRLHVDDIGDPANPAVVLWPSLYCTGAVWHPQLDALTPRYRLLVIDPPGHGRSGLPPRRFTLEATAEATAAVLDAFGVGEAAIIGGAWGGMVGIQMLATCPGRVRAVALVNSPLDVWRGRQRLEILALLAILGVGGPKAAASILTNSMLSGRTRAAAPERARELRRSIRALDRRGLLRGARSAMLLRPSLLPLLPHVEVPVLAVAGADDSLWPEARARAEVSAIPGARFEVVAGTAHLTALEAPEVVNPMLLELLSEAFAAEPTPPG